MPPSAIAFGPPSTSRLADFITLPLTIALPAVAKYATSVDRPTHYLYVRPHEPRGDEISNKPALFVSNLPIDATESSVKSLFNTLCAGRGRVERTVLQSVAKSVNGFASLRDRAGRESSSSGDESEGEEDDDNTHPATGTKRRRHTGLVDNSVSTVAAGAPKAKKIKRIVVTAQAKEEELLAELEAVSLPNTWENLARPLPSGSCAVVYFVDKSSLQSCLKACRRAAAKAGEGKKSVSGALVWESPADFATGRSRYTTHHRLTYPSTQSVRQSVNAYLTTFTELEKHRRQVEQQLSNEPDEDGFITVTKATRNGITSSEAAAAREREAQRKEKTKIGSTFYRFQVRERMKEKDRQLRVGFEQDVRRLHELRAQKRGR